MIEGARQIGKTYIIRKVSKELFPDYIEVNFVTDAAGAKIFENIKSVEDFYFALSTIAGDKMKSANSKSEGFTKCFRLSFRMSKNASQSRT